MRVTKDNFESFHAIKRDVEELNAQKTNGQFWFQVDLFEEETWVPQARTGAVLINIPGTNIFYLFGGVNSEPMDGIAKLSVHSRFKDDKQMKEWGRG